MEGERDDERRSLLEALAGAVGRARDGRRALRVGAACGLAALVTGSTARADGPEWDTSLRIESDLRFRLNTVAVGDAYASRVAVAGVERNQNLLGARVEAGWENVRAVGQVDLVVFGYQTEIGAIGGLTRPETTQPWRIDVNELYLEASGLVLDDLDVRLGQQIVAWGVGDQFNPTNTLNPDDLRDPLLFGKQAGNFMAKADYWVTDDFRLEGVLIPLFRPALLPPTAGLGPAAIDRLPFADERLRWRILSERAAAQSPLARHPTIVDDADVVLPEPGFENMQAAFRMAGTIAEQDVALSYYLGRNDFPTPLANVTSQRAEPFCGDYPFVAHCADGRLETDVTLGYARMHVYGLNTAGEIPLDWLADEIPGLGWRLEAALVVPTQTTMRVENGAFDLGLIQVAAGEYDYDRDGRPGGPRPVVVESDAYLKWVLGLDYTLARSVYVNAQWVHGLIDEFGAGDWLMGDGVDVRRSSVDGTLTEVALRCALAQDGSTCAREMVRPKQGDYAVLGVDVRFLDDQALARIFALVELSGYEERFYDVETGRRATKSHPFFTPEGFSAALFPELSYNFGNGLEVSGGALFQVGAAYTKFGDPAAGGSVAFVRGRYTL